MKKRIGSEFERIGKLVQASGVSDGEKEMAVWCLKKLPALCETFCQTYETRDVQEILRLERGMLVRLQDPSHPSPQARDLAKVLSTRLRNLHEQLGLPQLEPSKLRPVAQRRSRNSA
jgi:hypothetical protein